jgi:polar amino acid transport system substrate-binding protein
MRISLILVMGFLISSFPTFANELVEESPNVRPVRFALMELRPYGFYDEAGMLRGYLYDLANEVMKTADLHGEIEIFPVKRMVGNVLEGSWDCTFVAATDFVKENFYLVEKIGKKLEGGIIPRSGITLDSYQSLYNYDIAVPHGVTLTKKFDTDKKLSKVLTEGYQQSIKMLDGDRLEAIAGAIDSLKFSAKQIGIDPTAAFGEPLVVFEFDIWFACSHDNPSATRVRQLQEAVITLRESGRIKEIVDGYLMP